MSAHSRIKDDPMCMQMLLVSADRCHQELYTIRYPNFKKPIDRPLEITPPVYADLEYTVSNFKTILCNELNSKFGVIQEKIREYFDQDPRAKKVTKRINDILIEFIYSVRVVKETNINEKKEVSMTTSTELKEPAYCIDRSNLVSTFKEGQSFTIYNNSGSDSWKQHPLQRLLQPHPYESESRRNCRHVCFGSGAKFELDPKLTSMENATFCEFYFDLIGIDFFRYDDTLHLFICDIADDYIRNKTLCHCRISKEKSDTLFVATIAEDGRVVGDHINQLLYLAYRQQLSPLEITPLYENEALFFRFLESVTVVNSQPPSTQRMNDSSARSVRS